WPFNRIDEQDTAISHVQNALNLTTEVGMSRSINNIDLNATIDDSSIFSENSNTPLTFLIVGIHDQFAHLLILAEDVALFEESIDQRGFAVIDVGNNSNIADIVALYKFFSLCHSSESLHKFR